MGVGSCEGGLAQKAHRHPNQPRQVSLPCWANQADPPPFSASDCCSSPIYNPDSAAGRKKTAKNGSSDAPQAAPDLLSDWFHLSLTRDPTLLNSGICRPIRGIKRPSSGIAGEFVCPHGISRQPQEPGRWKTARPPEIILRYVDSCTFGLVA